MRVRVRRAAGDERAGPLGGRQAHATRSPHTLRAPTRSACVLRAPTRSPRAARHLPSAHTACRRKGLYQSSTSQPFSRAVRAKGRSGDTA